jgi:hypothetical protein
LLSDVFSDIVLLVCVEVVFTATAHRLNGIFPAYCVVSLCNPTDYCRKTPCLQKKFSSIRRTLAVKATSYFVKKRSKCK